MRLKDIEGFNQEECAQKMQVSRQTFQNIIDKARNKVAVALVEGKAISIEGGHFKKSTCLFKCMSCNKNYEIALERDKKRCKLCGSSKVLCQKKATLQYSMYLSISL